MVIQWAGTRRSGLVTSRIAWAPHRTGETFYQALTGGLTCAGAVSGLLVQQVALAGGLTCVGEVSRNMFIPLTGGLAFVGALGQKVSRALTGGLTMSGVVAGKAKFTLVGVLASSGIVVGTIKRTVTGGLTCSGALARKAKRTVTGAVSFVGQLVNLPFTLTFDLPAVFTRYAPRPLLTLTIGAETKRYSSTDVYVSSQEGVGVAQVGESQVGE